jgi:hypothetical protein
MEQPEQRNLKARKKGTSTAYLMCGSRRDPQTPVTGGSKRDSETPVIGGAVSTDRLPVNNETEDAIISENAAVKVKAKQARSRKLCDLVYPYISRANTC